MQDVVGMLLAGVVLLACGTLVLMRHASLCGGSPLRFLFPWLGAGHVREYWRQVGWAALLRWLGTFLLLLALLQSLRLAPEGPLAALASSLTSPAGSLTGRQSGTDVARLAADEQHPLLLRPAAATPVSGAIGRHRFEPDRITLVDQVLTLAEGDDFLPRQEIRILFPEPLPTGPERRLWQVEPNDPLAPEIHVSVRAPGQEWPDTRIHRQGYRMTLQLAPVAAGQVAGVVQLLLPDQHRSHLSGRFVAATNQLRYVNGRVDPSYDHPDTLRWVAEQFLAGHFPPGLVVEQRLTACWLQPRQGRGEVQFHLTLANGRQEQRTIPLMRGRAGWEVLPGQMLVTVLREAEVRHAPTMAGSLSEAPLSAPAVTETVSFAELDALAGQTVTLIGGPHHQRRAEVLMRRGDRLILRARIGAGEGEFAAEQSLLRGLMLEDGRVWQLSDGAPWEQVAGGLPTDPGTAVADPALAPWRALRGRMVRVTGEDGRQRTGLLVEVTSRQVTLEVPLGAGNSRFFYKPDEISLLERVEP